jgi:hypothetical protein
VGPEQPELAVFGTGERFLEADLALADGLDFASGQDDAGLDALDDLVIVQGLRLSATSCRRPMRGAPFERSVRRGRYPGRR